MSTRMLIDARHPEETRVTVIKGSRVEEFDYESATRRQLKGNIYLARVTRVEPSLQAAFVEYGGNRHGFLAFSEIHPDYYQIPVEDREQILAEETQAVAEHGDPDDLDASGKDGDANEDETEIQHGDDEEKDAEIEEAAARRRGLKALKRKYNIQEVIKRRQVLLVQVVKEERGNKGAALTTYLSLAGRYCVLMPNSTHSGGISRKISSATDRKRLKKMISDLEVPEEMGLIVRTAGMKRTKTEIKRDYEYMMRLWNGIREKTLESVAPTLVYEEGNLIKRTIRDLYTREVDEILVEGEEGYRAAKDFMKLLMPSHAKKVQHYKDHIPLFHRYQVENHLEAMFQPVVQLKSGGYIVINPTEALISIDVNSGRSTREHNIEETALKTNLEASEEVARQLRLRDMAGLVVIDFIDMEERNNNRAVERRMKDVLKADRARIQVGRISSFGLMEMSRQRLRPNLLEVSMETCPHCSGTGIVRSVESASLMVLRQLEEEGIRGRSSLVRVTASPEVSIYLLNKKRSMLTELESRYNFTIEVTASPSFGSSETEITREAITPGAKSDAPVEAAVTAESLLAAEPEVQQEAARPAPTHHDDEKSDDDKPRRKRRRRRRRRRGERGQDGQEMDAQAQNSDGKDEDDQADAEHSNDDQQDDNRDGKPRRRRGSRGGRRRRGRDDRPAGSEGDEAPVAAEGDAPAQPVAAEAVTETADAKTEEKPKRRTRARKKVDADAPAADADAKPDAEAAPEAEEKPKRRTRARKKVDADAPAADAKPEAEAAPETEEKPKRRTRARKKADADAPAADAKPEAEAAPETEEKPKRRTRARKKVDADAPAADADTKPVAEAAPEAEEKPKRRTRKAAPKADAKAEPKAKTKADAKADAPAKPEKAKPAAKAKPAPKPEDKPVQKISVSSDGNDQAASPVPAEDDGGPKRKGWWQRTFG
ncbi:MULTISPECIES: Rne/Rng family ribonuclease [Kordiimonas]|uniref:Rne/Rng family ribonuclease n=1 Tax=Kordiimonas TaxID=288021 RepID=UPI00257ED1EF|nr:Rne/Rng family ribonuclease [Kordiimonas sp. UBA4487]